MSVEQYPQSILVRVPATTANLGVGFDVLGMALDFGATFTFTRSDNLVITGYQDSDPIHNLVWTSYCSACELLGVKPEPLAIHEECPIPASGGLGSSSTCIVAGIVAAQVLNGKEFDRQRVLNMATQIEGHPDNVAPAVMGGLVSSFVEADTTYTTRWSVSSKLRFVCLAPPYRVLTKDARQAMPKMVPTELVSWQVGRCLAMASALASGNVHDIAQCCDDRLHEPYRAPLIADYERLRSVALDAGAATFLISGSGATMLAITDSDEIASTIAERASHCVQGLTSFIACSSEGGASVSILS